MRLALLHVKKFPQLKTGESTKSTAQVSDHTFGLLSVPAIMAANDSTQTAIAKINSFDFTDIRERILKEDAIPADQLDEAIEEFKKFMSLVRLGRQSLAMCSPVVDEVWHALILFTEEYATFCQEVFGSFVHHRPKTSRAPLSGTTTAGFAEAYQEVFGQVPPIWEGAAQGLADCSGSTNCQCDGDPDIYCTENLVAD